MGNNPRIMKKIVLLCVDIKPHWKSLKINKIKKVKRWFVTNNILLYKDIYFIRKKN